MSRGDWAVNTTNEQADIQSAAALARLGINPSAVEDIITGKPSFAFYRLSVIDIFSLP